MSRRLTDEQRRVREAELRAYHAAYRVLHPDNRRYAERKSNKRLRLTNTYSRMRQRIDGRCTERAIARYAGLSILPKEEFLAWAEQDATFNRLFEAWVASGFVRRLTPSIDRIDPRAGYQRSNMQWLTLSDNALRARETRRAA